MRDVLGSSPVCGANLFIVNFIFLVVFVSEIFFKNFFRFVTYSLSYLHLITDDVIFVAYVNFVDGN